MNPQNGITDDDFEEIVEPSTQRLRKQERRILDRVNQYASAEGVQFDGNDESDKKKLKLRLNPIIEVKN